MNSNNYTFIYKKNFNKFSTKYCRTQILICIYIHTFIHILIMKIVYIIELIVFDMVKFVLYGHNAQYVLPFVCYSNKITLLLPVFRVRIISTKL